MKKIIFEERTNNIYIDKVAEYTAIFAKEDGKFAGMIVKEKDGWILRTGALAGATGHHATRASCLESCLQYGFTFYTEQETP
jgi:hypothetical protein